MIVIQISTNKSFTKINIFLSNENTYRIVLLNILNYKKNIIKISTG